MMLLLLKLLTAHVLGDFVLQPSSWVKDKKKKKIASIYLYFHIAVHALALLVLLQFDTTYWQIVVLIVISHFIIDALKISLKTPLNSRQLFFIDQLLHLLVIVSAAFLATDVNFQFNDLWSSEQLLLLFCVLCLTSVCGIVMKIIMSTWSKELNEKGDSLSQAGKYIGILERLFVFSFIILNQWAAIGFLITAKSVFRFGDLSKAKDRKLTEYVLIGTLVSFGLAILIGLGYIYVRTIIV